MEQPQTLPRKPLPVPPQETVKRPAESIKPPPPPSQEIKRGLPETIQPSQDTPTRRLELELLLAAKCRPRHEINVLLLGETGVGKSTFINAFVNYLKFESLDQAERGDPVVLIPVSFLITIGNKVDKFVVKYGNVDSNEDHEHQAESVTQHCKSYLFDLNDQVSLRLIDSPGIAQNVKNIDHILTYINTLSHLNAVCLLLNSSESRLSVCFRTCIDQLLTYLTPIAYENIIFSFTNSRQTFYTPGETGRLLREMLNQEHLADIPFQKQNTFCFDSESFRYLAARRCQIEFDDFQKVECRNSWKASVTESRRMLDFIQTRSPYRLQEYQSPRKAVLDIHMYARALMEALRLIIYNWKITEAKLVFNQMKLASKPVINELCTHCAQANLREVGPFWITQYQPAAIRTTTNEHRLCPPVDNHFLIEAVVQHQFFSEGSGLRTEQWQSSFHNFLLKCDRIHHFLRQQGPSTKDDPFGLIIERFLEDEQQISQIRNIDTTMNRRVREILQSIRQIRQRNSQQLFDSNERLSVRNVYQIIDELIRIPTVQILIQTIMQSRQAILKTSEHQISANIIHNRAFQ